MKIKLGKIKFLENFISKVSRQEVPAIIAYRVNRSLKPLRDELVSLEEARINLVKKYAGVEEDSTDQNIKVPEDKEQEFTQEYTELLQQDVEIEVDLIDIKDLEKFSLTIQEIDLLSDFIKE